MIASSLAYDTIKTKILTQEFLPGSQLKENDLCKLTGLTRTPIREAIIRLQGEKLLEIFPNKGAFVIKMSEAKIVDSFDVREALELKALSLAIRRSSRDEILTIQKALTKRKEKFQADRETAYFLPKIDFHYELIKLSKNEILIDIWKGLHTRLQLFRVRSAMINKRFLKSTDEHLNILQHIYDNNLKKAEHLLKKHIRTVRKILVPKA